MDTWTWHEKLPPHFYLMLFFLSDTSTISRLFFSFFFFSQENWAEKLRENDFHRLKETKKSETSGRLLHDLKSGTRQSRRAEPNPFLCGLSALCDITKGRFPERRTSKTIETGTFLSVLGRAALSIVVRKQWISKHTEKSQFVQNVDLFFPKP